MTRSLHILLLVLLVALACQRPRTIPRDDMEDIFYEMLVQDQQVKRLSGMGRQADTSQVYAGIFKAHGYRTEDFRHSMSVYLEDPSHMEKIMGAVAERLEKEAKLTKKEVSLEQWRRDMMRIWHMPPDTNSPKPRVRPVDTLRIRFTRDSVWMYYPADSLDNIPPDSLLFVRDSLAAVKDSAAVRDTVVSVPEPVMVKDSIRTFHRKPFLKENQAL